MVKVDECLKHQMPETTLPSGRSVRVTNKENLLVDGSIIDRADLPAFVQFVADAYDIEAKERES